MLAVWGEVMRSDTIDYIYDTIDEFLLSKEFDKAVAAIKYFQNTEDLAELLSILTITLPWRNIEPIASARKDVLEIAKVRDLAKHGNLDSVKGLM